ncbi:hypothetical protein PUN28_009219 [Cardiocondyla obscurior]|uniref:Regulatory protein zeste n=1 Tax=Cardiocondyla obscurior TaxID=286306 RepID=A0AAW2FUC1_9HYME
MRPCRSSEEEMEEEDNGRRRNQFSKDERLHLLNVMNQYAPLLDDKRASVFDRREIWRAIERDFHQAGFASKTSAQLKKYWQNYKYHGRKAQAGVKKHSSAISRNTTEEASHPENRGNLEIIKIAKEPASPCASPRFGATLGNIGEPGRRQREIYGNNGAFFRKLSAAPIHPTNSLEENQSDAEISQSKRFSSQIRERPRSSSVTDCESEKPIGTDVIVSNTDVSDNSVTVSVICPERAREPFSRNQPKRKQEVDASPDRFTFQSCAVSAASPGKKRKDDDQSIFLTAAGAAKGRCFLLQPRQTDNHGEVISNRRNAIELRRKLKPAKEKSPSFSSKFASSDKVSCSVSGKKILKTAKADSAKGDPTAFDVQDTIRDSTCREGKRGESKIGEYAAPRNQRDDPDETANDAVRSRGPNARLQERDRTGPIQSGLEDELNYRLTLHRLETEEKRLKVKIAEMAIQEIRFRIRALNEDIRRADELHELHLALATAQANTRGLHV